MDAILQGGTIRPDMRRVRTYSIDVRPDWDVLAVLPRMREQYAAQGVEVEYYMDGSTHYVKLTLPIKSLSMLWFSRDDHRARVAGGYDYAIESAVNSLIFDPAWGDTSYSMLFYNRNRSEGHAYSVAAATWLGTAPDGRITITLSYGSYSVERPPNNTTYFTYMVNQTIVCVE